MLACAICRQNLSNAHFALEKFVDGKEQSSIDILNVKSQPVFVGTARAIIIETERPRGGWKSDDGRNESVQKREGGVLETRQIPRVGFSEDKGWLEGCVPGEMEVSRD